MSATLPVRSWLGMTGWLLMAVLSVGVAGYALYGVFDPVLLPPFVTDSPSPRAFLLHMLGAGVALLLGPWQFRPGWKGARSPSHRWIGRTYLIGVLIGAPSGLWLAFTSQGGAVAHAGFLGLAIAWMATGAMAYGQVRAGDYQGHRRWMVRNFALTFAAVMLRIYLPVAVIKGLPYDASYAVIAWGCWVPNLLLAEWWVRSRRPRRAMSVEATA